MLDADTTALVQGGSGLLVGTVRSDGVPYASRAWGLEVVTPDPLRVRLLLDPHETEVLANLETGCPVAVTAADVKTFRSVQLKGTSRGAVPRRTADGDRFDRYVAEFFGDIEESDHKPRDLIERLRPADVVAVEIDVTEVYDQTPGPAAGRSLEGEP